MGIEPSKTMDPLPGKPPKAYSRAMVFDLFHEVRVHEVRGFAAY